MLLIADLRHIVVEFIFIAFQDCNAWLAQLVRHWTTFISLYLCMSNL